MLNTRVAKLRSPAPDSTRLVLLGLLARYGPQHGYDLRGLIEQQHLDRIADISAHFREISKAERRWTDRVLKRIEAGGYPTPGRTLEEG